MLLVPIAAVALAGCRRDPGSGSAPSAGRASRRTDRLEAEPGALRDWNVLLVSVDTLRADHVRCYGHQAVETPVLDGLARRGVRFAQAIAPTSITLPSHVSMLTGLAPQRHGARVNGMFKLGPGVATLAQMLAEAGYRTGGIVSVGLLHRRYGLGRGFGHYGDTWAKLGAAETPNLSERRADAVTSEALGWLDKHGHEKFFLWLHYFDPHFPYAPPAPFKELYGSAPYDGEIAYTDQQFGLVIRWLEAQQLLSRTLVVVTADHGEAFGEHGETQHGMLLYETTLHVPLIFSGPAPMPQGHVVSSLAGLVDVVPTILALVGRPIPDGLDGRSLLDPPAQEPRALYIETLASKFFHGWAPLLGVRRADYKFILAPQPELYDLRNDARELQNLYKTQPEVAGELYDQLRRAVGRDPELVATVQANLPLTPDALRQLKALGYVTDSGHATTRHGPQTSRPFAELPNPKDMVQRIRQFARARALMRKRQFEEAITLFEQYTTAAPEDGVAQVFLGLCHRAAGHETQAAACFGRAEKSTSRKADVASALGGVYAQQGDHGKAIAHFRRALAIDREHPEALEQLGRSYRALGRDAEAMAAFDRLSKAWDGIRAARARYEIGRTHLARGRRVEAQKAFALALKADPSHAAAANALKAMRTGQADPSK